MQKNKPNNRINSDRKKLRCAPLSASGYAWRYMRRGIVKTSMLILLGITAFLSGVAMGQDAEDALNGLSPDSRAWVSSSCSRSLGPSLWSSCVIRESAAASRGKPDISKMSPEFQNWIRASCSDSLGPSLTISCIAREKASLAGGLPDTSFLSEQQRQWVSESCSESLGPSLYIACVRREAGALRGSKGEPARNVQPIPAPAQRMRPSPSGSSSRSAYEIEVSHNDELFVINGEKYEAKTYCFGMEEGDQVIFLSGSPYCACASAELLNLRTKKTCGVWCE